MNYIITVYPFSQNFVTKQRTMKKQLNTASLFIAFICTLSCTNQEKENTNSSIKWNIQKKRLPSILIQLTA